MTKPLLFFSALSALLATPIYLLLTLIVESETPLTFLYTITISSYLMMAIDKRQARTGSLRVPETLLLGIATLGGTVGVFIGSITLHHKTKKPRFLLLLLAIGAIQMILYRAIQTSETCL